MKIGVYNPYLDTLGGGERYMLSAASCLAKQHDVYLYWNDVSILKKAEERFSIDLSRVEVRRNIFSGNASFFEKLAETRQLDRLFYLSDGSIPLSLAKKTLLHFQFPVPWVRGRNLLTQTKLRRGTKIICNSEYTKRFIDKIFGRKSAVLYPPVGESEKGEEKKKENHILTVGRFSTMPNGKNFKKHDMLIQVFKNLVDDGLIDWQLLIVTSYRDDQKDEIKKLEELSHGYPIHIKHNLRHEELQTFYQTAKVYWHAAGFNENLVSHPERAEHFGITTVEAMRHGVVPVVINVGGQPEIVIEGKSGLLWNSEAELQEKTLRIIKDESIWQELSTGAKARSHNFSTERFCRELQQLMA